MGSCSHIGGFLVRVDICNLLAITAIERGHMSNQQNDFNPAEWITAAETVELMVCTPRAHHTDYAT
jgi:hypothetical protein